LLLLGATALTIISTLFTSSASAEKAATTGTPAAHALSANVYTVTNLNSGKCLDVAYGGTFDFNGANQYTCYNGPAQQWRLTYVG